MTIRPSRSNLDFMTAPGNDPDSHGVGWPYPHYRVPSSRSFLPTPSASTSTSACTFALQAHISHTLPSELWIEIFTNLSSSADISNITLTCTTFCTLAQPLLFATLDVCPFHLGYNRSGPILRSHAYLKRTKERIALYTSSSKIRSNVRTVWISPYPRNASSRTACIGAENGRRDYLEPELVIEEVVNVLEMFPNLTSLSWHAVEMKWEWWNIIRKLNLSSLWINASAFPAIGPPPPLPPASLTPASESEKDAEGDIEQLSLPVQHLHLDHWAYNGSLMNHVSVAEAHSPGVQLDILTLTIVPSVIETLSVPRPSTAHWIVGLLSQYGHQGAAFQQLTSLSLPYSAFTATAAGSDLINTADNLAKALEVCPKLEELQIFEPPSVGRSRPAILPSLPVNTLPALHTFEGPATFASTFVDGSRPLRQLTLWGLDGPGAVCDVEKLETILQDLADLDVDCKLESLKINVSNVTTELLEALRALRGMKLLSVNSGTGEMVSGSMRLSEGFANFGIGAGRGPVFGLYDLLCNTRLPPALESLKISSKLDSRRSDALDGESQQTEALELIACLKMDNPSLENVEIAYGGYWMGNYCVKWNRNATRRPRFDESSRKRFSSIFWEGSMGVAGNKGIIELDVNDIIEGAARRRGESRGVKGLFGWISRLWSCLL